jgi:DNA processing protein
MSKHTSTYRNNLSRVSDPCYSCCMKYLNALNLIPGIGPQKMKILLNYFSEPKDAWKANLRELGTSGISEKLAKIIVFERNNISPEKEWRKLEEENVKMVTLDSLDYPDLLKEIHNPPYILYAKGHTETLKSHPIISIVGSRKCSHYGTRTTLGFAKELSVAGFTIVSGMALGIDTFAHRGALEADGKTIAVLGNGLDDASIYPKNNFNLSREIMENGLLLSEYPIGTQAGPLTFPARNRIIAGLSLGTLVTEANEKSGALITAQMALDYNREIFSVPGQINSPGSFGTNNLIKKGAKVTTSIKDILEELDFIANNRISARIIKKPSSPEEETILNILTHEPIHIDNISKVAKLQTAKVASTLSMMEIKGWVKNIGGQNYIITQ